MIVRTLKGLGIRMEGLPLEEGADIRFGLRGSSAGTTNVYRRYRALSLTATVPDETGKKQEAEFVTGSLLDLCDFGLEPEIPLFEEELDVILVRIERVFIRHEQPNAIMLRIKFGRDVDDLLVRYSPGLGQMAWQRIFVDPMKACFPVRRTDGGETGVVAM